MPSVNELVKLIEAINPNAAGLPELKELVTKISKSTERLHIEIDYDGSGTFYWKVVRSNLTASEFVPKKKF